MAGVGKKIAVSLAAALVIAGCGDSTEEAVSTTGPPATAAPVTIAIESWRSDDSAVWNERIIPAFEAEHPGIEVVFAPSPALEYDAALASRLEAGDAGDLITCRPFDASSALFDQGHLAPLDDLPGIDAFDAVAQSAWITDDGSTPFCVPIASVIHGFIYNVDAFDDLGLSAPETEEQFFAVLDAIAADGAYVPLAIGTAERWEAATMGFQNIGPNHWNGEAGRKALIDGSARFTDQAYLDTFASLARWSEYLPPGASTVGYADARDLFTSGRAAVYPAGSWEIAAFNADADFAYGAFKPPLPDGRQTCHVSDHTDIAIGLNAASPNAGAARPFLSWVASPAFAAIYANALPGFFSLQDAPVELSDPVAREFASWREGCESTIRNSYQILSRGQPNLEQELWATSAAVLEGTMTPREAVQRLQDGLDSWYTPTG